MDMENKFYKESVEEMDHLIEASIVSTYRCEVKGNYAATFISDNIKKQFGYESKQFIEDTDFWVNHIHPDDVNRVLDDLSGLFEHNFYSHEYRFLHTDGTYHWVNDKVVLMRDSKGEPIEIIGNLIDVTERRSVEDALRDSEKLISTIFESTADGLLVVSTSGDVICTNKKFKNIWDIPEEIIKKKKDRELLKFIYGKILEPKKFMNDVERLYDSFEESLDTVYLNSGKIFECYSSSIVLNNKIVGRVWSFKDITEREKIAESLKKIAVELQQSNEELEEFAYVASHDLQEPLRIIASYCQLLKEKYYHGLGKEGQKYIDYTVSSAIRMKILIKELLDFSRVGKKDKPFEYVDVKNILQETLTDYQIIIADSGAKIIINDDLPVVFVVRFRMRQLISNIISNALKFKSNRSPVINMGCRDDNNFWLFYIKDNGIGIDSKFYDRIFGVFKRLYSIDEYPGTGIGLALCKRIVETHGGKIWVDSEEGKGTCIYFTIPKSVKLS